jgi:hypothetical protein
MDSQGIFPKLEIKKKTGNEVFHGLGAPLGMNVGDFWKWAASDLVSNSMRGILAEYIVANALGITGGLRTEWDAFDLLTTNNQRIEVKSASYIQSWQHTTLSKIIFGIRPTRGWDAATNTSSEELKRQADIYVFCVLAHKEQETLDPLDLNQWDFYILRSEVLNQACPTQKTIGLGSLLRLEPARVKFDGIKKCIDQLVPLS